MGVDGRSFRLRDSATSPLGVTLMGEGNPAMITLTINGATHELDAPITIAQYLDTLGLAGRYVAVARNGDVLGRETFPTVTLEHGDRVEIVRPVGGG